MIRRILVFVALLVVLDVYLLTSYQSFLNNNKFKTFFRWFYILSLFISYGCFALVIFKFDERPTNANIWLNWWFGYTFAFVVLRIGMLIFTCLDDIIRITSLIFQLINKLFIDKAASVDFDSRRKFIGQVGLGLASLPFVSMLYGVTRGKYNYKVKEVALSFKNLPKAFDGLKIVHISDIHSGSFDDFNEVKHGVDLIQAQNPDLILFTGDLVNNQSKEIIPYKELFGGLSATFGKVSTLGNHDYAMYNRHWNADERKQDVIKLCAHQKEMGFELLNNANLTIEKEGQEIDIIGVENWGAGRFPKKGDLDKALTDTKPENFKVLLSHDPTHWDEKVIPHNQHIDLTLSGHTHGMQFGVEIPGFKWSPSKYIYKRWAGLYQNSEQYLYVNRGFGFLGFPGRVGIWPEITKITLHRENT